MSEPSKTIPPPAPAWSPDQPLRADATDEQIIARYHAHYEPMKQLYQSFADITREFAAACLRGGAPASGDKK